MTIVRSRAGAPNETRFGFSQAVGAGPLIYVAGQVGKDNVSGAMVARPGFVPRLRKALANVADAVGAAGGAPADVVELRVHLDGAMDERWPTVLEECRRAFGRRVALTGVQLAGLASPDYLVEISATAIEREDAVQPATVQVGGGGGGGGAVRTGDWIHVGGQPGGAGTAPGSTAAEALEEAIERFGDALAAVDARLEDVVSTHLHVVGPLDTEGFAALCDRHRAAFGPAPPAATLVLVDALPWPGARAQLSGVAYAPRG